MEPVITIEDISKCYRIGANKEPYLSLRGEISKLASRLITRNDRQSAKNFWALKHVTLRVQKGEALGIIGRNGAGKSTLLKILSQITPPTEGRITMRGRVASLLEVGTGFHPELTGRENIFLNGAILGMTRAEIKRKFDEIVDFSEIEQFLDTPVKRYSSGMYVRLAFAVAAHLEPEILVVDEVLAVGDAEFQKKCLGKMEKVGKEGRTVLFVSHNTGAIARLCQNAICLDSGKITYQGICGDVISNYQKQALQQMAVWVRPKDLKENTFVTFQTVESRNANFQLTSLFNADERVVISIRYSVRQDLNGCQIGVRIFNQDGSVLFSTADCDHTDVSALPRSAGAYQSKFEIPGHFLRPGSYYLSIAAHLPHRTLYEEISETISFTVTSSGWLGTYDGRLGLFSPKLLWETLHNER